MQVTYILYHNKIYTSPRVGIEHLTLVYMFYMHVPQKYWLQWSNTVFEIKTTLI